MRAIVEGTAYGAYDAGLFKRRYAERPELTLVARRARRAARASRSGRRWSTRHLDAARDLANRPPNDLTPEALAQHAHALAGDDLTVETHGRDWIEATRHGRVRRQSPRAARATRS